MTRQLFKENNDFGAAKGQITLMKQEKVPALQDNDARIAPLSARTRCRPSPTATATSTFLHQSGLVKKWASQGKKWVYFFQDTNASWVPTVVGYSRSVEAAQFALQLSDRS